MCALMGSFFPWKNIFQDIFNLSVNIVFHDFIHTVAWYYDWLTISYWQMLFYHSGFWLSGYVRLLVNSRILELCSFSKKIIHFHRAVKNFYPIMILMLSLQGHRLVQRLQHDCAMAAVQPGFQHCGNSRCPHHLAWAWGSHTWWWSPKWHGCFTRWGPANCHSWQTKDCAKWWCSAKA